MTRMRAGQPDPPGATFDGQGVNFAFFSRHPTAVDLCLFDDGAQLSASDPGSRPAATTSGMESFGAGVRLRYGYRRARRRNATLRVYVERCERVSRDQPLEIGPGLSELAAVARAITAIEEKTGR